MKPLSPISFLLQCPKLLTNDIDLVTVLSLLARRWGRKRIKVLLWKIRKRWSLLLLALKVLEDPH